MPLKSTQNKKMKKISDRRRKSLYGLGKWQSGAIMLLLAASLSLGGCKTIQYLPINTDTQVHYVDSIRYEIRDSVRITEATRYRDMAWLGDTLSIEGKRSSMWATADTAKGAIIGGLNEKEVEERTKVIYRDRWKTKDSLVFQDRPVPVEKPVEVIKIPLVMKILSVVGLLSIAGLIIWLVGKIKGFDILKKIRLK